MIYRKLWTRGVVHLTTIVLAAALLSGLSGDATADTGPVCDTGYGKYSTQIGSFDAKRRPLVLVHGWTDSLDGMKPVEAGITQRMPNTFDFRYFDYRDANTEWASSPRVASCLAHYVHDVSASYRNAGGDGKVLIVAHSMGGLAARFASQNSYKLYTDNPLDQDVFGGLTTIDTPHLGSLFGNRPESGAKQWLNELFNQNLLPDRRSDAVRCLALHGPTQSLPADCATPTWLPPQVPLAQVGGDNVVRRTIFGVNLYDIDLRSDGVVGIGSSTGYLLGSGPSGTQYPQAKVGDKEVNCTITSDQTINLLKSFRGNLPAGIIQAEIKAIGLLANDSAVLDQINSGNLGPNLEAMLLTAALVYPCSHGAMLSNPQSLDAITEALKSQLQQLPVKAPTDRSTQPSQVGIPTSSNSASKAIDRIDVTTWAYDRVQGDTYVAANNNTKTVEILWQTFAGQKEIHSGCTSTVTLTGSGTTQTKHESNCDSYDPGTYFDVKAPGTYAATVVVHQEGQADVTGQREITILPYGS